MRKRKNLQIKPENFSFGAKVDLDQLKRGVVKGVKVLGLESRHGYTYTPKACKEAIPLYEGARVNIDHPARKTPGESRSYRDRFGFLKNVRFVENEGLFADFRFNTEHANAGQFIWDVSNAPDNCGFSHNAKGPLTEKADGSLCCESIEMVRSVDLVADAATTNSLFEGKPRMKMKVKRRKADPRQVRRQLIESFGREAAKVLMESLDPSAQASLATAGTEGGADGSANVEALIALIRQVLADPNITADESIKQVSKRLKALKDMIPGGTAKPASDGSGGMAEGEDDDSEEDDEDRLEDGGKKGKPMKKTGVDEALLERLERLEARQEQATVRELCESFGFRPTEKQLKLLSSIEDDETREELIESWQETSESGPSLRRKKGKAVSKDGAAGESETSYKSSKDWAAGLLV